MNHHNCIEQLASLLQQLSADVLVLFNSLEELVEIGACERFCGNSPAYVPRETE
jgi:hypothetical protein